MSDPQMLTGGGAVWFAGSSDREPGEPQAVVRLPAVTGDATPTLRATYNEIPQVSARHGVLLSKPVWAWGGELGVNDRGVAIAASAALSRGLARPKALLASDLVRLGLERGADAAQAAAVIVELLERHGHGGPDGLRRRRYQHAARWVVADAREACEVRTAGGTTWLRALAPAAGAAPSFERMAALLRAHARGNEDPADGGNRDTCLHATGFFRQRQTAASMIVRLAAAGPTAVFTGTAAPCLSIFRPAGFDGEFSVLTPAGKEVEALLWRRHEFLHRRALADAELRTRLCATRDPIEAKIFAELAAERPSPEQLLHADRLAAAWHKVLWEALPQQPAARGTRFWTHISQQDGIL